MSGRPLRVLVLPSCYPEEDTPLNRVFFKEQAAALCRHGIRADVAYVEARLLRNFSPWKLKENHFQVTETIENGIRTVRIKGWNTLSQTVPGALLWVALTLMLAKFYRGRYGKPDLLHAQEALWAGYAASLLSRQWAIPYVITEHSSIFPTNTVPRYTTHFLRRAYGKAHRVLVVSSSLGRAIGSYHGGAMPEVVPNIVDTDFFTLPDKERRCGDFVFLSIGWLVAIKRHDLLIRAFAEGFHDRDGVFLEIGGDGPERDRLVALAHQLGVADRVRFLGTLSRTEVRNAMWRANIFVHASLAETFGVVVAEALATGLYVISTRCGGPDDILAGGGGILVPPDNVDALREAMETGWSEAPFPPEECRRRAVERFSTEAVIKRLGEVYRGALAAT